MTNDENVGHKSKLKRLDSGVISDRTHTCTNRSALKSFMKKSKVLRYREKMENVKLWRNKSIAFAAEPRSIVDNPSSDLVAINSDINF